MRLPFFLSFFFKEITVNRPGSTCRVETATDLKNIKKRDIFTDVDLTGCPRSEQKRKLVNLKPRTLLPPLKLNMFLSVVC